MQQELESLLAVKFHYPILMEESKLGVLPFDF